MNKLNPKQLQKLILEKYRNFIKINNGELALMSDVSLETFRKTIKGNVTNLSVMGVLYEEFQKVEEWKGKMPKDLKDLFHSLGFTNSLVKQ